ncbi:tectonin domain-containing protein [Streptomyces atratus]|uniref:tectonin domain-containing protein n=1 Tax=Streptomyces atratus TaxID=1893 RepID=UPI0036C4A08B
MGVAGACRDSGNQIYRYSGDQDSTNPWKNVSGSLKRIAVGSWTNVWGVDPAGSIYLYTGDQPS